MRGNTSSRIVCHYFCIDLEPVGYRQDTKEIVDIVLPTDGLNLDHFEEHPETT